MRLSKEVRLTDQQELFCQHYVVTLNATEAAISAGYAKSHARTRGSHLLATPHVLARVKELQKEIGNRNAVDADAVIAELAKLAFYNVQDFVKDDNGIERLKQMARTKTAPVVGIKVSETFSGTGKRKRTNVTTEIKLADKSRALELLGKHLGIFEKDNRQKSQQILIKRK